jgi:catechol 2,3-dioxygenase
VTDSIDPGTSIGAVHLNVSDLGRSVRFYEAHLGLRLRLAADRSAWLSAGGPDLLILTECEAAPRVRGTTGLYHFAVLVPSRVELARSLRRLVETDTIMQGFADHGVSEALYLADVDGNGIEIYRDRPRAEWPMEGGRLRMVADPLDLESILGELQQRPDSWPGLSRDTIIGHVHLHVSRLADAEAFYVGMLGFDLMQRYGPSALFVSAGGYHHHIGLNTWAGVGAPPPPPGAIGLRYFVVKLPDRSALDRVVARIHAAGISTEDVDGGSLVRDPAQNAILLTAADNVPPAM